MLADEIRAADELDALRQTAARLQRQLAASKAKTADLVDAIYRAAKDAATIIGPASAVAKPPADRRKATGEVALLHASDWQMGKITGTFSMDVLDARLTKLAEKVSKLTAIQRADHPVRECVLMLGGDMVEGVTVYPGQAWEVDASLFEQTFRTVSACEKLIRNLSSVFDRVTVYAIHGNHGRIGRKGDVPTGDNVDRMVYKITSERFAKDPRVSFHLPDSWYQIVEIGNYRALLVHGDQIKSFGGNLPAYGILRKVNAWKGGVLPDFHDAYLGHFHTPMTLVMSGGGRVFVCGSPESDNAYAHEFVAAAAVPSQRVHFVDPERGRVTGEFTVWLD